MKLSALFKNSIFYKKSNFKTLDYPFVLASGAVSPNEFGFYCVAACGLAYLVGLGFKKAYDYFRGGSAEPFREGIEEIRDDAAVVEPSREVIRNVAAVVEPSREDILNKFDQILAILWKVTSNASVVYENYKQLQESNKDLTVTSQELESIKELSRNANYMYKILWSLRENYKSGISGLNVSFIYDISDKFFALFDSKSLGARKCNNYPIETINAQYFKIEQFLGFLNKKDVQSKLCRINEYLEQSQSIQDSILNVKEIVPQIMVEEIVPQIMVEEIVPQIVFPIIVEEIPTITPIIEEIIEEIVEEIPIVFPIVEDIGEESSPIIEEIIEEPVEEIPIVFPIAEDIVEDISENFFDDVLKLLGF